MVKTLTAVEETLLPLESGMIDPGNTPEILRILRRAMEAAEGDEVEDVEGLWRWHLEGISAAESYDDDLMTAREIMSQDVRDDERLEEVLEAEWYDGIPVDEWVRAALLRGYGRE